MKTRVVAGIVVEKDGKILLIRERNGKWNLPAGGMEPDETIKEAAIREAMEEAGISVDVGSLVGIYQLLDGKQNSIVFIFRAALKNVGNGELESRWLAVEEIRKIMDHGLLRHRLIWDAIMDFVNNAKISLKEYRE